MRRKNSSRSGFTLLEMLVAVTLLALMAALLTGSLRFGLRVWETGERTATETKVATVQRLLYQWLNETEQMRMPGESDDLLRGVFEGNAQAVRFLSVQARDGLPGGYFLNELFLEESGEGHQALVLRRRPVQTGDRGLTELAPSADTDEGRILLDRVADIEIAYYGRETTAAGFAWLDDWRERLDLPRLVRVRLSFAGGDRRRWTDLIVPLAMAGG